MGGLILIIEDDEGLGRVMRDWLKTVFMECDVLVACHGNGDDPALKARPPQAILIDVDTVGAECVEAIRHFKRKVPEASILALTMDDHEALRKNVLDAGADACIRKTEMGDRLLPLLEDVLGPDAGLTHCDGRRKTVLCIEDELEMIKLIELTLERGPFRVLGAVSGQQGIDIARHVRPDVVLLDLMMPDMDGWEVARRLRADEELRDVPIIAVSVVHPSSYPARELVVDDYVTKPFVPDDLLHRVGEIAQIVA
jgi:DNA-binding response OmpR family regulator